jgi:Zn-dependent M28 family amino/carboxypeptidase
MKSSQKAFGLELAFWLTGLLSLWFLGAASAQSPSFVKSRIDNDIKILSSDAFGGRGINTVHEVMAISYLADSMKSAGLSPAGGDGTFFQKVSLRQFGLEDINLNLRMGGKTHSLNQGQEITMATRGALGDVRFDNSEVVFVGYGITAPERGWDDYKDIDVRGKIVMVLINDPDFLSPSEGDFGGKAMTYYGRWTYKYEEAARRGAKGVLIIHDTDAASYGWDTVRNSFSRERFDIVRDDPSQVSPPLEAWVQADFAKIMVSSGGHDLDQLRAEARTKAFQPKPLQNVSLLGGYKVKTEVFHTANVIGILKGKTKPDEIVLHMAHWDHIGIGAPDSNGDGIFNGAVDNASGTAALLELARAHARAGATDRSLVFMAVTAEESGLLGSEYYADNPVFPLAKTVGGINMDGLNLIGRAKDFSLTGYGQSNIQEWIEPMIKHQDRVLIADQNPQSGGFFRSDHFPMVKRGIPMLYGGSGRDLRKGGVAAGQAAYNDYVTKRYHQPNDEYRSDFDYSGAFEDMKIYYQLGRKLGGSVSWPQFYPQSEFKRP